MLDARRKLTGMTHGVTVARLIAAGSSLWVAKSAAGVHPENSFLGRP